MLLYPVDVPNKAKIFMGDDEALLEHLLYACQKKEVVGELYQRDLTPFNFDEFETFGPKKPTTRKDVSPQAVKAAFAKPARKTPAGALSPFNFSPAVSATASPTANTTPERKAAANRTKALRNNGVPLKMQSGHAGFFYASPIKTSTPVAACPGFFSSPKPEAIPMPTSSFLQRAASAKA